MSRPRSRLSPSTLAYASATDRAHARMRAAGRRQWNQEDYSAAVAEYHRLNPCPTDVECELCNIGETQP